MSEPQWKCPFKTSLFLTCKILPFYIFFPTSEFEVFFLSLQVNASWATLATTKQALFGVMHGWSDVSLMWEEGTTLGLKPGVCDLLPYILYLLVITLSLRVTMQKSTFETTKQCLHINDHPWHPNHQEGKLIELVISLTILMEFMWYDALQLNSILIFHYLTCCI